MNTALNDHLVRVADLVGRPGLSRQVDLLLPAPEGIDRALALIVAPVRLHGVLESVVDGILVRSTVETTLRVDCARCLKTMHEEIATDVVELFSVPGTSPEVDEELDPGYEIEEGQLSLDVLLRDTLVPATPYQPLCLEDCRGLCASCGADHNITECSCRDDVTDPRWQVLESLDLPEDHGR